MAACASSSLSPLSSPHLSFLPSNPKPKLIQSFSCFLATLSSSSPPLISSLTLSKNLPFRFKISQNPINHTLIIPLRKPRKLKVSATSVEDAPISAESAQEIVSATSGDDGVSNVVSTLLFIAFIGLSILTIGVVYIAVTDFLQKREKERFEKEEAANNKKKKGGKKVKAGARASPRGFGQKRDEEEEYDD